MIDAPVSQFWESIRDQGTLARLLIFIAGAVFLLAAVTRLKRAWALADRSRKRALG